MTSSRHKSTLNCFLLNLITKISNYLLLGSLWVSQKLELVPMYVNWKALLSLGFAFWGLLCCTDLLGESTWKRCSNNLDDILKGQYNELTKMHYGGRSDPLDAPRQKMSWSVLLWNICAFLCSLIFCSILKSMSWIVWKIIRIYNVFRNRKTLSNKLTGKNIENDVSPDGTELIRSNCKIIFKNQQFTKDCKEFLVASKEVEDLKKEKTDLAQQLLIAQKENLTARQQIEEYKLETFMMKEKLARTASSLKENLKYKDFANANQELMARKALNLEVHLKEVSRDRDILRSKLNSLEKNYNKLEDKLKLYEKPDESESNLEQFPEKDTNEPPSEQTPSENDEIPKFQQKIIDLQRNIDAFQASKKEFEGNSKISVDLESSLDTKENDSEERSLEESKPEFKILKQNLLNYNAYKTQMLRPKMSLGTSTPDTTGSSSDENSGPHRIISSTVEFQNFLKTLNSSSKSSVNFKKSTMF